MSGVGALGEEAALRRRSVDDEVHLRRRGWGEEDAPLRRRRWRGEEALPEEDEEAPGFQHRNQGFYCRLLPHPGFDHQCR